MAQKGKNPIAEETEDRTILRDRLSEYGIRSAPMGEDAVTGLLRRQAFTEEACRVLSTADPSRYIMLCMDVRGFKQINLRYGFDMGDRLLRRVAEAWQKATGDLSCLSCRDHGDTFYALFPNDMELLEERLQQMFTGGSFKGLPAAVSFRTGIYVIDDPESDINEMMDRAYLAYSSIRGSTDHRAFFTREMEAANHRRTILLEEAENALRDGQFTVLLQPQFSTGENHYIGAEALVRWNHPREGTIHPGEFVPLFEQSGFISEVDRYVREEVCRLQRSVLDSGRQILPISVNISRYDIVDPNLPERIAELTERYGLPKSALHLEITESAYMDDPALLRSTAYNLQLLGFTVEMDDFGSGYSSLNVLKDIPVNILKLDMHITGGDKQDERGKFILESVIALAKGLSIDMVAEGVETAEQAQYLSSMGCVVHQGYYYSKPITMEEYIREILPPKDEAGEMLVGDTRDFFDVNTQTVLLQSKEIRGGACIALYHDGQLEVLRYTEAWFQELNLDPRLFGPYGRNLLLGLTEEGRKDYLRAFEETCRTGGTVEMILNGFRRVGKVFMHATVRRLAERDGAHLLLLTVRNVTDEKNLEKAESLLQDESEKARAVARNEQGSGTVIYTVQDGRVIIENVSEGMSRLAGIDYEELMAQLKSHPDTPLSPTMDRELRSALLESALNKIPLDMEVPIATRGGGDRWARLIGNPIELADGVPRVYVTYTDVTVIREAEERLAYNRECLEQVNNAMEAVTLVLPLSLGTAPLWISRNIERVLGYTAEKFSELRISRYMDHIHPEDEERFNRERAERIENPVNGYESSYRFIRKDGTIIWIMEKGVYVDRFMGEPAYVCVLMDISAQKAVEETLRLSEGAYYEMARRADRIVLRYNHAANELSMAAEVAAAMGCRPVVGQMPYGLLESGLVPKNYIPEYVAIFKKIVVGEEGKSTFIRHKALDGTYHRFRLEYSILRDGEGVVTGALIWLEDQEWNILGRQAARTKDLISSENLEEQLEGPEDDRPQRRLEGRPRNVVVSLMAVCMALAFMFAFMYVLAGAFLQAVPSNYMKKAEERVLDGWTLVRTDGTRIPVSEGTLLDLPALLERTMTAEDFAEGHSGLTWRSGGVGSRVTIIDGNTGEETILYANYPVDGYRNIESNYRVAVHLPMNREAYTLRVELDGSKSAATLPNFCITSSSNVYLKLVEDDLISIFFEAIWLVMLLVAVIYGIIMKAIGKEDRPIYAAILLLNILVCSFAELSIMPLLPLQDEVMARIGYFAFMLLPLSLMISARYVVSKERVSAISMVMSLLMGANMAIQSILSVTGLMTMQSMQPMTVVCLIAAAVGAFARAHYHSRNMPIIRKVILRTAYVMPAVTFGLAVVLYRFHGQPPAVFCVSLGMTLFILMLFFDMIYCRVIVSRAAVFKKMETEAYKEISLRDIMTGLGNRRAFNDYLEQVTTEVTPENDTVLVFLDLNGLKVTNDTLGHDAGDEFIRSSAEIISRNFSPLGVCYRLGGDEFAVVIENFSGSLSEQYENVTEAFRRMSADAGIDQSVSMGESRLSEIPTGPNRLSDWRKAADGRMYACKAQMKAEQKTL